MSIFEEYGAFKELSESKAFIYVNDSYKKC